MTDREKVEKIVEVVFGKQVAEYDPKFNTKNFQPLLPENIYQCFLLTDSEWFRERFECWDLSYIGDDAKCEFSVFKTRNDWINNKTRFKYYGEGSTRQEAIINCFCKMPEIQDRIKEV